MTARGDIAGLQEANQAVVRHALADVPSKTYTIEIDDIQGVWEGATEPSVSIKVEAKDERTLNAIRARLSAVSALFEQDELHEIEYDVNIPENIDLGGRVGFDHYQPYAVIELDREVAWSEVEDARAKSGIMGASFNGKNILVYKTDDTPQVFAGKVGTLLGAINETGRVRLTYRSGHEKIRRNARTHSTEEGIIGYAEGSILDGEASPLATDIALRILRHTGGRLKAPMPGRFSRLKTLPRSRSPDSGRSLMTTKPRSYPCVERSCRRRAPAGRRPTVLAFFRRLDHNGPNAERFGARSGWENHNERTLHEGRRNIGFWGSSAALGLWWGISDR